MFKNLFNFGYQRGTKEAIGFYIAFLVLIILIGAGLAAIVGIATNNSNNFDLGARLGGITAIVIVALLAFSILKSKKLLANFPYLALGLLACVLAYFGGALLGLIPVAYLTTREAKK